VHHESGALVRFALDAQPEPIVVAMARQVGALSEGRPVRILRPVGAPVQVAGAETIAALQANLHGRMIPQAMRRLDRYILLEVLGPLALGFLVYTFIMLLQFLFKPAELIIRRGLPAATVGKLLLYTLPNILVLTIPMALLFGVLVAIGRLAS